MEAKQQATEQTGSMNKLKRNTKICGDRQKHTMAQYLWDAA